MLLDKNDLEDALGSDDDLDDIHTSDEDVNNNLLVVKTLDETKRNCVLRKELISASAGDPGSKVVDRPHQTELPGLPPFSDGVETSVGTGTG